MVARSSSFSVASTVSAQANHDDGVCVIHPNVVPVTLADFHPTLDERHDLTIVLKDRVVQAFRADTGERSLGLMSFMRRISSAGI